MSNEVRNPLRSKQLDRAAEFKRRVDTVMRGEKPKEVEQEPLENFKATVDYLSDLINAANRDNLWANVHDATEAYNNFEAGSDLGTGTPFLALYQTFEEGIDRNENASCFIVPLDPEKADAVRKLLKLPTERRRELMESSYYKEDEGSNSPHYGDAKYSGITSQLYNLLENVDGHSFTTALSNEYENSAPIPVDQVSTATADTTNVTVAESLDYHTKEDISKLFVTGW